MHEALERLPSENVPADRYPDKVRTAPVLLLVDQDAAGHSRPKPRIEPQVRIVVGEDKIYVAWPEFGVAALGWHVEEQHLVTALRPMLAKRQSRHAAASISAPLRRLREVHECLEQTCTILEEFARQERIQIRRIKGVEARLEPERPLCKPQKRCACRSVLIEDPLNKAGKSIHSSGDIRNDGRHRRSTIVAFS